jgi:hypothetical protein
MVSTPSTLGVLLLFIAVFLVCILWATHGHTAHADPEAEDVEQPGKMV